MQKKIKYLVFSFLLIATACTNKYQSANVFYKAENYTVAIEEYDKVINKSANGYEVTLSEIDRSESYFQLGMRAFERNNYNLAIRLFYLANSDKADEKIIDSYLILIDDLKTKDERNRVIATYNYLIDNLYRSERTPLLIFERICLIYEWYQNEEKVWEDYSMLYEKYPESEYLPQAQEIVDNFLPKWIEALVAKKNSPDVDLDEIISSMVYLKTIPNNYHENISKEIALIYIQMAEELIKKQEYVTAEKQFRRALEYDIDQAVYVQKRLNYVCDMFVSEGNDLIKQ
jgi:tetratricopeptide (TPR) repeat protein